MAKKDSVPESESADSATAPEIKPNGEVDAQASLEEAFNENLEKLQEVATEYIEQLSEAATVVADQAREVYSSSQDYVREHPGGVILGAFAVGVVLGALLGRRD